MIWQAHFAPTELDWFLIAVSYKHSAPTELKAFACGPNRASEARSLQFKRENRKD